MLKPFFDAAMLAPGRQLAFRRLAVAHVLMVTGLSYAAATARSFDGLTVVGYLLLVLGLVEGAVLVGWRLTQLPKSQALEFLLVSPIQPRRVFVAEALVGLTLLAFVTLSGLPALAIFAACGVLDPLDLAPLTVVPFTWGAITGVGLAVW